MIKVVQITQITPHPTLNSLKVCQVSDGNEEATVVCAAKNIREGMKTIFAGKGDTMPSGAILKSVDFGGVSSQGMLCSAKDLQVSQEAGVVDLPNDIQLATPLKDVPPLLLASTPWHSYQQVDSLYLDEKTGRILVIRDCQKKPQGLKLISQTYFYRGQYHYRHFTFS